MTLWRTFWIWVRQILHITIVWQEQRVINIILVYLYPVLLQMGSGWLPPFYLCLGVYKANIGTLSYTSHCWKLYSWALDSSKEARWMWLLLIPKLSTWGCRKIYIKLNFLYILISTLLRSAYKVLHLTHFNLTRLLRGKELLTESKSPIMFPG